MKRVLLAGAGLIVLAGCGGGASPVGENSADSITTTAVGNVVAAQPSPTPTPVENAAPAEPDDGAMSDDSGGALTNVAPAADAAASQDTPHAE